MKSETEKPQARQAVWEQLDYAHDAIIEASAGTGKTYAIQNIVLRLICDKGYSAPQILVVTFTEKAAGELKSRIRKALLEEGRLTGDFDEMTICTIHSFCKRIIDEYAFESGMPMRCDICASQDDLVRRAANSAVRSDAFKEAFAGRFEAAAPGNASSISDMIGEATDKFCERDELKEYAEYMETVSANPAAAEEADDTKVFRALIHRRCDEIKAEEGVLTYDDLVTVASDVIAGRRGDAGARDHLLDSLRRRYRVALVDEFQDTDERQWELFRTLFSSANNGEIDGRKGFLVVVGDPKQAIYSFRGADVGVYCKAREWITAQSGKPPLTLDATYRSSRSLVDAFNEFFGEGGEFGWFANGAAGQGIDYSKVRFPEDNEKFSGLGRDDEMDPVALLESVPDNVFPTCRSKSDAHLGNRDVILPTFADAAAEEMKRLRSFTGGSKEHPIKLTYGKMCVLVKGAADAAIVRDALSRHGIPYSHYKQRGLFASAEAEGVMALLDFLACPSRRGRRQALLLSPIFDVRPRQLVRLSAAFEAQFDALSERLLELAARSDWVRLFETVMNSECTALAMPGDDVCAFNRRRSATRQIFDAILTGENTRRCRDCRELADAMRALREADAGQEAENGSLYEKESAADRVQIMTLHASKGLQFPVVFVAYGFSPPKEKKDPAVLAEIRRLLYVAITRAEHRVYFPWSRKAKEWTCEVVTKKDGAQTVSGYGIGSSGAPLAKGGFLANAIMRYAEKFEKFEKFENSAEATQFTVPDVAGGTQFIASDAATPNAINCDPPATAELRNRRIHWESFTTLQSKIASKGHVQITRNPAPFAPSVAMDTLLPRSNISGNVFHEVMEALCRNDEAVGDVGFMNAHLPDFEWRLVDVIRGAMRSNALANIERGGDSTERTLMRMVRLALSTSFSIGDDTLMLSQIPRRDRLAEVDFVLGNALQPEVFATSGDVVLNGMIDLVVRVGGKAFIIDWKTNSLCSYSPEFVIEAMDEENYHLQYKIYSLAAKEWLEPRGLRLGGVAYLFVRGGEHGIAPGVFTTVCPGRSSENP